MYKILLNALYQTEHFHMEFSFGDNILFSHIAFSL